PGGPAPPVNRPASPVDTLHPQVQVRLPARPSLPPGLPSKPPVYARGLNYALIYYAAASPPHFPAGQRSLARLPFYGDYGGAEWLPFPPPPPPPERIDLIAQQSVDE